MEINVRFPRMKIRGPIEGIILGLITLSPPMKFPRMKIRGPIEAIFHTRREREREGHHAEAHG